MNKKFLYTLLLILFPLCCFAQVSDKDKKEIAAWMDSLEHKEYATKVANVGGYHPFYEIQRFWEHNETRATMAGARCTRYLTSVKMELLKNIYLTSQGLSKDHLYNLVDSTDDVIHDIMRRDCGGRDEYGRVTLIDTNAIDQLYASCQKWFKVVESKGYSYVQKKKITPVSFCNYKWVKEIGFVNRYLNDDEIRETGQSIIRDSIYLRHFINTHFKTWTVEEPEEYIAMLTILAMANRNSGFTPQIRDFGFTGKVEQDNKTQFQEILESLSSEHKYVVADLAERGIFITLRK